MSDDPERLRRLATWYRDQAERAENPWVWEARLHTAEDLEARARRIAGGGAVGADEAV